MGRDNVRVALGSVLLRELQTGAAQLTRSLFGPGADDRVHDGERVAIDAPAQGGAGAGRVLYVNGAATGADKARAEAAELARVTHRDVLLIDNATEVRQYRSPLARALAIAGGSRGDGAQILADHAREGANPAVDAMREEILHRMRTGQTVEIAGYSQGASIAARALGEAKDTRTQELRATLDARLASAELESELSKVRVLNIAGAAKASDFPAGIDYHHVELPGDPVVAQLGEASGARRDAELERRLEKVAVGLALDHRAHQQSNVLAAHAQVVDALF